MKKIKLGLYVFGFRTFDQEEPKHEMEILWCIPTELLKTQESPNKEVKITLTNDPSSDELCAEPLISGFEGHKPFSTHSSFESSDISEVINSQMSGFITPDIEKDMELLTPINFIIQGPGLLYSRYAHTIQCRTNANVAKSIFSAEVDIRTSNGLEGYYALIACLLKKAKKEHSWNILVFFCYS